MKEPDSFSAFSQETPRHKPLITPTGNCLGRHIEHLAQIFNRVDRFIGFFNSKIHGIRYIFHEKTKIMDRVTAVRGDGSERNKTSSAGWMFCSWMMR